MSNKTWRNVGRVLKYCGLVIVFTVCGILLWRIFSSGDPQSVKTLMVSDATYSAYQEKGDELCIYYQNQQPLTRAEHNYGFFGVTDVSFIPEADQLQVVFRYNNSTLKNVAELLKYDHVHGRDEDVFDISVVINTDKTPDRTDDNAFSAVEYPESVSAKRYFPSQVKSEKKNVYNYRKYIFENVSLDELTLAVFVDIYYKGNDSNGNAVTPNYGEAALGTLCIYDYKSENIKKTLTSADLAALEEWKKQQLGE